MIIYFFYFLVNNNTFILSIYIYLHLKYNNNVSELTTWYTEIWTWRIFICYGFARIFKPFFTHRYISIFETKSRCDDGWNFTRIGNIKNWKSFYYLFLYNPFNWDLTFININVISFFICIRDFPPYNLSLYGLF